MQSLKEYGMPSSTVMLEYQNERRKEEAERIFKEIIADNFLNLMKNINFHIQESQQTPYKINIERST